jgi:hypothetical protein
MRRPRAKTAESSCRSGLDGDSAATETRLLRVTAWPVSLLLVVFLAAPVAALPEPEILVPMQNGWPVDLGEATGDAPVTCVDLDSDGRLDVVVPSGTEVLWGDLTVFERTGMVKPGWPILRDDQNFSVPSFADLDGDGTMEILLGSGSRWVYAYHHDGTLVAGWPWDGALGTDCYCGTIGPVVADIDGDGQDEILSVEGVNGILHLRDFSGNEKTGWPWIYGGGGAPQISNTPAVADMDGDGTMEIAFGTTKNNPARTGRLYLLDHLGAAEPGWPLEFYDESGRGPLSMGDLDGDGDLEIVIARGGGVRAYHHDGSELWFRPDLQFGEAVLGDLDGDGLPEIVAYDYLASLGVTYHVLDGDGTDLPGWPVTVEDFEVTYRGTVIGDLDGDGRPELVIVGRTYGWSGSSKILAFRADGTMLGGFPIINEGEGQLLGGPTMCDLDGDGDVELLLATGELTPGKVYVWDFPGTYHGSSMDWPMYHQNLGRTGQFRAPGGPHTPAVGFCSLLVGLAGFTSALLVTPARYRRRRRPEVPTHTNERA